MFEDSNLQFSLWTGDKTQRVYKCIVHPLDPTLPNLDIPDFECLPAVYIFSKALSFIRQYPYPHGHQYPSIYIGETGDLNDRFNRRRHHRLACLRDKQAAYLHVFRAKAGLEPKLDLSVCCVRREIECDLKNSYQVLCPRPRGIDLEKGELRIGGVPFRFPQGYDERVVNAE